MIIKKNVFLHEVAKLISDKNIVAWYQGRGEAGPRALGNRSILYTPLDVDGKDHVNVVKKRESYRPFGGTILLEHANDWFDMRGLKESPYMMYALNVLENKKHLIPCITHVDGTCRAQTVTSLQNKNYYDLINEFYKITNVPILFNTSLNLSGEPIVETEQEAIDIIIKSKIEYLYLPEEKILIKEENVHIRN